MDMAECDIISWIPFSDAKDRGRLVLTNGVSTGYEIGAHEDRDSGQFHVLLVMRLHNRMLERQLSGPYDTYASCVAAVQYTTRDIRTLADADQFVSTRGIGRLFCVEIVLNDGSVISMLSMAASDDIMRPIRNAISATRIPRSRYIVSARIVNP